jgi:hypothetical protein
MEGVFPTYTAPNSSEVDFRTLFPETIFPETPFLKRLS